MKKAITILFFGGAVFFGACGSEEKPAEQKEHSNVDVAEERVRPAAKNGTSAAYFSYQNPLNIADTLLSVQAQFANLSQVHESYETEGGMMGMREQKNLILSPKETITFKQGGLHVMLMGLNRDLSLGDSVAITLNFSQSGVVSITIPVKD